MNKSNFTEEDKKKLIDFLNMVAKNANFQLNTQEIIEYYGLLSHMQTVFLKKVDDHILEVIKVIEDNETKEE